MAFLSNKSVNYLNLHFALMGLLEQSFNVFMPVYLYTHGFSFAGVMALFACAIALRLPIRFLSLPFIRRFGLKRAAMLGAAGYGLSFPVMSHITGMDGWLALYLLIYTVFNSMHWLAFHTLYSMAGETEKRGRQVAAAYAATAILSALAPLLSAFAIVTFGYNAYFMAGPVLVILMVWALSQSEDITPPPLQRKDIRPALLGMGLRIHLMESASFYPMSIVWMLALYLYVGKILSLGGVLAFGIVVRVLYQLTLGIFVDKGKGTLIVNCGETLRGLTVLSRAFLPLSLPVILGLEAAAGIGDVHHCSVQPTALYNAAKHSVSPFMYWLFAEMAWDIGSGIGAGGAALLLWQGMSLRHVILLALPFLAILWWVLHRYFSRHAYVIPAA